MDKVEAHYANAGLLERVKDALRQSNLNPDQLDQFALSELDQFHVGGLDATDALIRLARIQQSDRVLDLGSGIGGPSRYLAATVGCQVTGLDLTEEYCKIAIMLANATGLSPLLTYRQGDALATPFENETFNVVWTQHAAMNIKDKGALYREIFRLLKTGGRLALHDILAGDGELRFPVPWARNRESSFLISEKDLRATLVATGFNETALHDVTKEGIEALRKASSKTPSPGFGLHTLLGPEFPSMIANLIANLESGACRAVQAVFEKSI